jgi:membrane-associated phospholipid phosphatase/protein-S-isoprenylcysteine O-methyltransferase Ste14
VGDRQTRWKWICLGTTGLFLVLALAVRLVGVPPVERHVYDGIRSALSGTPAPIVRWITRLGSETILFPASVFLIVLLPRQFLRHWWVWVTVMLAASMLEGLGKTAIGRPRPNGLRPGFPSGHTAAAAFFTMACYFAEGAVRRRSTKFLLYAVGALLIGAVGLSRMALGVHWPLDVLGGAALGIAVLAGAVWWHEQQPDALRLDTDNVPPPAVWDDAIYRWQSLIVLGLVVVFFVRPPMATADDVLLDLMFDVSGGGCVLVGLLLRLWAAGHTDRQAAFLRSLPTRYATTGPYALMRHPMAVSTFLIAVGVVLLAESGPGLTVIPAMLIITFRVTIPLEEAHLAQRCGRDYVDYCHRVPRWPHPRRGFFSAVAAAISTTGPLRWQSIVHELPAVAAALILVALAEASEFMPHILR